ncbi:MAG: tRNA (adenosine(37)-N6)-threonylcarbamoyltransferase complex transferase subunit TsaD [Lentisphaerae bacterium]|nr:tRNA (adenosine(37)-N6)-threonylcarbamoyltransferase complex transferase subunit TsaD [Lentisphaerota bacterium]
MRILGLETSCDETAAAVADENHSILSSVVSSQVELHRPWRGVVPELASRQHLENLPGVVGEAMARSATTWDRIDAVAATTAPGLASSLLVGVAFAKALALRLDKPFIAINHLEAHLFSVFLAPEAPDWRDAFPLVALIVSGGHTCLVRAEALGVYRLLGRTVDDAAGEAFDKGANLLGLEYPGGPAIDRCAQDGNPKFMAFPRSRVPSAACPPGLVPELCFSFSGLKTALLYALKKHPLSADVGRVADPAHEPNPKSKIQNPKYTDLAASYQEAIVDVLADKVEKAVRREGVRTFVAAGGVSLNRRLRERLQRVAASTGTRLLLAPPSFCMDNAAMVVALAAAGQGLRGKDAMALDVCPNVDWG